MSEQNEKTIKVGELLEEIKLILGDDMVANYETAEDGLIIKFPNGQKFELSVKETV